MNNDKERHFKEELQLLLDDRLAPAKRLEVERHIGQCSSCSREFESLTLTKRLAAARLPTTEMPPQLERRIISALDREDRRSMERWGGILSSIMGKTGKPLWTYGLPLIMVGVLLGVWFLSVLTVDLPTQIAHAFVEYRANKLKLDILVTDVQELERGFEAAGVPFPTRVFDLGMMNYHVVGGRVHQLDDRLSAFFVYRNSAGNILICQMFQGHVSELPEAPPSSSREHNDIQFYIYRSNGLTAVFWQEGGVLCSLTSDIDPEEVVQLAFAKALKI